MNKLLNIGQWTLGVFFGLMALTGLLSFNLYGVGIFVCFVIATVFTIPPILAKIREERKKQGKDITSNKAILSAGFFALCGLVFVSNIGANAWKQIELPHAKPYVVYDQGDVYDGIEFLITANSQDNIANNADQFAQTTMQAVIDLMDKNNETFA